MAELALYAGIHAEVVQLEDESALDIAIHLDVELDGATLGDVAYLTTQKLLDVTIHGDGRSEFAHIDALLLAIVCHKGVENEGQVLLAMLTEHHADEVHGIR